MSKSITLARVHTFKVGERVFHVSRSGELSSEGRGKYPTVALDRFNSILATAKAQAKAARAAAKATTGQVSVVGAKRRGRTAKSADATSGVAVVKRGPGRPKGSKNALLFTLADPRRGGGT